MKHHCQLNILTLTLLDKCNNPHLKCLMRAPANGDAFLVRHALLCITSVLKKQNTFDYEQSFVKEEVRFFKTWTLFLA